MTQRQFTVEIRRLQAALARRAHARVAELRRELRENHNVIFVREHTVPAYWYERKPRSS